MQSLSVEDTIDLTGTARIDLLTFNVTTGLGKFGRAVGRAGIFVTAETITQMAVHTNGTFSLVIAEDREQARDARMLTIGGTNIAQVMIIPLADRSRRILINADRNSFGEVRDGKLDIAFQSMLSSMLKRRITDAVGQFTEGYKPVVLTATINHDGDIVGDGEGKIFTTILEDRKTLMVGAAKSSNSIALISEDGIFAYNGEKLLRRATFPRQKKAVFVTGANGYFVVSFEDGSTLTYHKGETWRIVARSAAAKDDVLVAPVVRAGEGEAVRGTKKGFMSHNWPQVTQAS